MRPGLLFSLAALLPIGTAPGQDWPAYRGPDGQGHASGKKLPVEWGEDKNIAWKLPLDGKAWSSPVVWGDRIWVTNANEKGTKLSVVCVDRKSGRKLYDKELHEVAEPQFCHAFNSYASPTPVLEDGLVYLTFGSPYTACLRMEDGSVVWERTDFVCDHFRGAGSSPILYKDLFILPFDGADHQFVAALDKKTGKTVWQTKRSVDYQDLDANGKPKRDGDMRKAYATPIIMTVDGRDLLISVGSMAIYAYEPETGKEVWRAETIGVHSASCRPVTDGGMVFATMGFSKGQLVAIKPDGKGNVTDSHVAWRHTKAVPKKPSPILADGLLYLIDDKGIASCLEAETGKEVWAGRIGGNFSASPILVDDRIYLFDEDGVGTVIATGRSFKQLAQSELDAGCMATPAVSGDLLLVRTKKALYAIREGGS